MTFAVSPVNYPRFCAILACLVLSAGCVPESKSKDGAPVTTSGPSKPSLPVGRFTPTKARARVHEHVQHDMESVTLEYLMDVCPSEEGGVTVFLRQVKVLLDTVDAGDTMKLLEKIWSAGQGFDVDNRGRFQRINEFDSMMERAALAFPEPKRAGVEKLFEDPALRAQIERMTASSWRTLTEYWVGFDPGKGHTQTLSMALPWGDAKTDTEVKFTEFDPGKVGFVARTVLQGKSLEQAFQSHDWRLLPSDKVVEVAPSGERLVQVHTRWPDLRTTWVSERNEVSIRYKGVSEHKIEDRTVNFVWDPPDAGPPRCELPKAEHDR